MSSSIEKLAKMFKERDNQFFVNVTTGEVISASPLKVKWGENIILEGKSLIVSNLLKTGFTLEYTDDAYTSVLTKPLQVINPLQVGDQVIMLPDTDFKIFYVIDKVG